MTRILIVEDEPDLAFGLEDDLKTEGYEVETVRLQKAIQKEAVDGDLAAAIKLYKQIVADPAGNRAVVAKALLHLGQCHEKLGNAEARKSYEQIVREYGDQADVATEARARLAAMTQAAASTGAPALAVRQIWAGPDADERGAISPDGKHLSFADRKTNDLAIRELATGKTRRLTEKSDGEHYGRSIFSPDGKQVAYLWYKGYLTELRIIGLDGSNPRVLYRLDEPEDWMRSNVRPDAWSPDGKQILALFTTKNGIREIALVSVPGGSVRVLKTLGPRGPEKMCFSPDGRYIAYDFPQKEGTEERDIFVLSTDGSRDLPLVQHPANDIVLGWAPDGKNLLFASDRTRTWDVWLVQVDAGKPQGSPELVKKDMGRITPLGFTQKGSFCYGLSTSMEEVFIATLDPTLGKVLTPPTATTRRVGGNFAPDWSPDGKYLAYVSRPTSQPGSHIIFIRSVETGEERELSPKMKLLGYNLRWSPDGRSILVRGYDAQDRFGIYTINLQTGDVLTTIPGAYWADWSRDGKVIFYAANDPKRKTRPLVVRDLATGQDKELFSGLTGLSLSASRDGRWLAFSSFEPQADQKWSAILKIMPATGGESRDLLRLRGPEDFGAVVWTPDGRQLLLVRRNLGERRFELWRVSQEGGEPQKIGLDMSSLCQISTHPDGRRIAYNAGDFKTEVWVMENLLPAQRATK